MPHYNILSHQWTYLAAHFVNTSSGKNFLCYTLQYITIGFFYVDSKNVNIFLHKIKIYIDVNGAVI
jgi:hypothetical protein